MAPRGSCEANRAVLLKICANAGLRAADEEEMQIYSYDGFPKKGEARTKEQQAMAFLFGCENVHLEYPTKVIFESLFLGVDDGDCVGVVGRNGDGKSSLLGLFDGTVEPDDGRVLRTGGVRFASLRQADELDDAKHLQSFQ